MFGTYFTGIVRAMIELGPSCVHAAGCPGPDRLPIRERGLRAGFKTSLCTFHSFFVLPPQSSLAYHDLFNSNAPTALNGVAG